MPEEEPLDGVAPRGALFQTEDEALDADTAEAADERGLSMEEMKQDLGREAALDAVTNAIVEKYPHLYSGGFSGGPDGPTVRMKGSVPRDIAWLGRGHGVTVVGGALLSFDEMTAAVEATARHLDAAGTEGAVTFLRVTELEIRAHVPYQSTLSEDDIRRNTLATLSVELAEDTDQRWLDSATADVHEFLQNNLVVIMEQQGVDNRSVGEHSYGGGEALDGTTRECTTGWSINLPNAIRDQDPGGTGIVTAAHCNGIDTYDDQNTSSYDMPHMGATYDHVGNNGDFEIHRSTHVEPDDFWADDGVLRDVTGIQALANIDEDDSVCVYGRTTNDRDCSADVMTAFGCSFPDHRQACGQVIMDRHVTAPGDSGGGWSWNNTAWGVHSSAPTVDGIVRSTWSPVARMGNQWAGTSVRS